MLLIKFYIFCVKVLCNNVFTTFIKLYGQGTIVFIKHFTNTLLFHTNTFVLSVCFWIVHQEIILTVTMSVISIEFNEYGDQELNLLNYELFHCSVTCYCFLYALNFRSQTFITFGQIIRYVKTAKYFIWKI